MTEPLGWGGLEEVEAATLAEGVLAIARSPLRQWDEAPEVYVIYAREHGLMFRSLSVGWKINQFPTAARALEAMAALYTEVGIARLSPAVGVAFRNEAWGVFLEGKDEVYRRRANTMADHRRPGSLKDHPDRVEMRLVVGALADGSFEWVHLFRETGETQMQADLPEAEYGGDIADNVKELCRAMCAEGSRQ